ncbi:LuxE/PaaK family acyltransferase [Terrimonas alba]|uniref:LuxE/PaaK family acyltransferase n=1 Tax=Terrimonas alba TaxID=3349636 RepID=UPI0035F483F5
MRCQWKDKVLSVTAAGFDKLALEIFQFQYANNEIYRQYVDMVREDSGDIQSIEEIPFLPIRFFKSHAIKTTQFEPAVIFESSGTTGSINSRHLINDMSLYKESFTRGFELFYGPVKEWCILGLLPSYLERNNSSLVFMVHELIQLSGHPHGGFYLDEYDKLVSVLKELKNQQQKTLLMGVTFGLLDFAEKYASSKIPGLFEYTVIMETGGMKGRRKEMIRQEVHSVLKSSFDVPVIHSEYGMTELLSQAYSDGNGIFKCPPWMKIVVRDDEDPFDIKNANNGKASGAINIIDLANIYSCSFIATDDAGRLFSDGSFEVIGRMDNSDLRGCSLMVV